MPVSRRRHRYPRLRLYVVHQDPYVQADAERLRRVVVLPVLVRCESKRKKDRVLLYFKRTALANSVKDCSAKMGQALQRFNVSGFANMDTSVSSRL